MFGYVEGTGSEATYDPKISRHTGALTQGVVQVTIRRLGVGTHARLLR